MPLHSRIGHIAFTTTVNRHHVVSRKTGTHVELLAIVDHRGYELFRGSLDLPVLFPRGWIQADNMLAARKDHLSATINITNQRCYIAADAILARHLPGNITRLLI